MPGLPQNPFEDPLVHMDAETMASHLSTTAAYIQSQIPKHTPPPTIAIICGSGLGKLCELLNDPIDIPYETIPGFVKSTVQGHAGKLVVGTLGRYSVLCMVGRFHKYEGYSMAQVIFPIRVFAVLKIKLLIVTNAAGGINPEFRVGDLMVIEDHLGMPLMAGNNPLVGPNLPMLGPRFPSMSEVYSLALRRCVFEVGEQLNLLSKLHSGIYGYVSGPQYETKTEIRCLHMLGIDAVGMSTVPEVVIAKHAGLHVLGVSMITNCIDHQREHPNLKVQALQNQKKKQAGSLSKSETNKDEDPIKLNGTVKTVTHEEVLKAGIDFADDMLKLIKEVILQLPENLIS